MATVGQALTAPETGWTRYDGENALITYSPSKVSWTDATFWNSTGTTSQNTDGTGFIAFNFSGSARIRLLSFKANNYATQNCMAVYIDGTKVTEMSLYSASNVSQCLVLDTSGLATGEHFVKIQSLATTTGTYNGTNLDAIDIDSGGTLKAYNENITPTTQGYSYII